jgi:trehalose-phosphatase
VTDAGPPPAPAVSSARELAAAVDALVDAPSPLLVVLDFDGTLAIGTRDPGAARIEPSAGRALRRLAGSADARPERLHVAVLTGRVVTDVVTRVRVGGVEYLGDHGLQRARLARGGRPERLTASTDQAFDVHRGAAEALATGVAAALGRPPWLFVERKGPSVAFHVRQADDVAVARASVVAAIERVERDLGLVHDLAHYRGRSVVDLRPRAAGGKREAIEGLLARHRPGAIVVMGDELSDVDAFEAVHAARAGNTASSPSSPRPGIVGITVAVHGRSGPAPAELLARADLRVAGPPEVGRFLAALARRIGSG